MKRLSIIKVKYLSPTNCKGARLSVSLNNKRMIISYPYALSGIAFLVHAAKQLLAKYEIANYEIIGYSDDAVIVNIK